MTDPVPSKEVDLTALMAWLRERHSYLVGLGAKETYEGLVHAHMESLQRTLRGIQSCSTCEACRGAATRVLGEPPGIPAHLEMLTKGAAPEPCPVPDREFEKLVAEFGTAISLWTTGGGSREDAKAKAEAVLIRYYRRNAQPPTAVHPDLRADARPYCRLCGGDHWVGAHDRAAQPPGDG